jgi:GTPase SAR1 family protein
MSVEISDWSKKCQDALKRTQELLVSAGITGLSLPRDVYTEGKRPSIVFAGQYSAGKSTLIKALTGLTDIAVGEGITTQKTSSYDWNGITVIDTPGIHTTLRPDHDVISYEAISNADLIVYVVTSQLFDSLIGANFRKLAIEKDKAGEMILVVNKMADEGNTSEKQAVKLEDIRKVTAPRTPEQIYTTFVDAQSYIDSLTEKNAKYRAHLRERSGYDIFVGNLNRFVYEKGLFGQLTTLLYQLQDVLQKAIKSVLPSSGNSDIDALEEKVLQERSLLSDTRRRIFQQVESIYLKAASEIKELGTAVANIIGRDNDIVTSELEKRYGEAERISDECAENIALTMGKLVQDYKNELDELNNSEFSQSLNARLSSGKYSGNSIVMKIVNSGYIKTASDVVVKNSAGRVGIEGMKAFSQTNAHQLVLSVGHFFGHSFKPWEAVKFAKGINVAGKVLGVLGVVLSVAGQVAEDNAAAKAEEEMRRNRENVRGSFSSAATELEDHWSKSLLTYLGENIDSEINKIDSNITALRQDRKHKDKNCRLLEKCMEDNLKLIEDIHSKTHSKTVAG